MSAVNNGTNSDEQIRTKCLLRWKKFHTRCFCTRFTAFSLFRSKELVCRIERILREELTWLSLPPVIWIDDADVHGSAACQTKPEVAAIRLAKGSCVNWVTTLVAYVHALSHHAFSLNKVGEQDRHDALWQQGVSFIISTLTDPEKGVEVEHRQCIRDSLEVLKRVPFVAEWSMSTPPFLSHHEASCSRISFQLTYAIEDAIKETRQDANQGNVRWRFQDEFDSVDDAMQQNGHVEQGSLIELALELKRDHDPRCKCCSHKAYNPREAKELAECLADEVLPLYLPVVYPEEPLVTCVLSSKPSRGYVDDRGVFRINLHRLETFADVLRLVVREWARRFAIAEYDIVKNVQSHGGYRIAVAGFSTLLIAGFPFDHALGNWFSSRDCLRMALVPAPTWPNTMIPLMRINQQGALKVLRERSFAALTTIDLDENRERGCVVREGAMHAGLEETCDFKDYQDFLTVRAPSLRSSLERPSENVAYEFRLRSVGLDVVRTIFFRGNVTVIEMTDSAVNLVSRAANVPDDPSLYEVRFNDELIDVSSRAADVAESGLQICVEPIKRQVQVLKGWTSEVVLDIGVPSTITSKDLLEIIGDENSASACIVQGECCVLQPSDTVDTRARLRVFQAGYVLLLAYVNVGRQEIRDNIVVEAARVDEPLENHLSRWRWTYGIQGEIECEGALVHSSATVRELADQNQTGGHMTPLRVYPITSPTERDIPVHEIVVQNHRGEKLRNVKLKSHNTLEKGFQMLCKITGMLPQTAQLTTTDGRPVDPQQRIYNLGLDKDSTELVLTRKAPPKPTRRKRVGTLQCDDHVSPEKRHLGKFAHPRPSVSCIVISSDSEDNSADEREV